MCYEDERNGQWRQFTEANPDKGTESISSKAIKDAIMSKEFTEANPDKGTESRQPTVLPMRKASVYRS